MRRQPTKNPLREEIHLKSPGTNAPKPEPDDDEGEQPMVTPAPGATAEKVIPKPQQSPLDSKFGTLESDAFV
jgi:hypothetical protein